MKDLSNETVIQVKKNELEYIQFKKLLDYPNVKHCFTLKPLDFGMFRNYQEKREEIEQNLKTLGEEFGFTTKEVCRPKQTHTDRVERINQSDEGIYIPKFDDIDGFVTDQKNKVLMVSFADCTPLLFYDPTKNIIGNTHSGWKGTLQKIGVRTVEKMQKEYGCEPKDMICCIGPHIRKCHFEVDEDVKDSFLEQFSYLENIKECIIKSKNQKNKYYIDTAEINKQILMKVGLQKKNIIDSNICTVCECEVCHSYRIEKELSGRSVSIMELVEGK